MHSPHAPCIHHMHHAFTTRTMHSPHTMHTLNTATTPYIHHTFPTIKYTTKVHHMHININPHHIFSIHTVHMYTTHISLGHCTYATCTTHTYHMYNTYSAHVNNNSEHVHNTRIACAPHTPPLNIHTYNVCTIHAPIPKQRYSQIFHACILKPTNN